MLKGFYRDDYLLWEYLTEIITRWDWLLINNKEYSLTDFAMLILENNKNEQSKHAAEFLISLELEKKCENCINYSEDISVNYSECNSADITEEEVEKYFVDYQSGCPYFQLNKKIIQEIIFSEEMKKAEEKYNLEKQDIYKL
jgi:uncharacterized protein YutD